MKPVEAATEGRFAYPALDRVMHERARLSVLTSLLTNPGGLSFNELKQLCSLTDGNLSRHLAVLEEHRLIAVEKAVEGGRPQTTYRMTSDGRQRFLEYLAALEAVIRDAERSESSGTASLSGRQPALEMP